jgi:excreted virulence factor EspC (type VII ESX diderm)
MTDQVAVRHTELITHAAHVDGVADQVTTAAQAGSAVRAGNDAYGKLCVMVPVMLNALQDVLVDGINAAAGSLRDTGGRLRATASEYESTDQRRADVFKAIGGGM